MNNAVQTGFEKNLHMQIDQAADLLRAIATCLGFEIVELTMRKFEPEEIENLAGLSRPAEQPKGPTFTLNAEPGAFDGVLGEKGR